MGYKEESVSRRSSNNNVPFKRRPISQRFSFAPKQTLKVRSKAAVFSLQILVFVSTCLAFEAQHLPPSSYFDQQEALLEEVSDSSVPTPPLDLIELQYGRRPSADYAASAGILPARVRLQRFTETLGESASPVFGQPADSMVDLGLQQNNDLVETGSGTEWDDSSSPILEETVTRNDIFPASISPTQLSSLGPDDVRPSVARGFNRAPELRRRLPKLAITAGQAWRYVIPADTFADEDGDLRHLASRVIARNQNELAHSEAETFIGGYFSWLQYDPSSRLLYGFPTETDAGRHELELEVSDTSGDTSKEPFEILVRPHQSTRAFSHLLSFEGLVWNRESFANIVDVLSELLKRLSSQVYSDQAFRNAVVHNCNLSATEANEVAPSMPSQPSLNLTWSNDSLPIHPCNLSQVESLFQPLVQAGFDARLERGQTLRLPPSARLLQALQPNFAVQAVSVQLQAACDGSPQHPGTSGQETSGLQVRAKIGKLNFRLGEPIEYRIPAETFSLNGLHSTRSLELSLHTIDGLTLDKAPRYSYLEFDRDSQLLLGLPYSHAEHVGQLELLLTARDPASGLKAREVFILSVEPVELSALNNRAFRVSLYLAARGAVFGARERIQLSHRVEDALHAKGQVTAISVERFARSQAEPERVLRVADASREQADDSYLLREVVSTQDGQAAQHQFFYKFTWTNASIGSRGDCPVEVIHQQVLDALTQSMLALPLAPVDLSGSYSADEGPQNASLQFFGRLRRFFEPEFELFHLRFEPMGACLKAFFVHDVGNQTLANLVDSASELPVEPLPDSTPINLLASTERPIVVAAEEAPDEYWLVVVLLILMMALIFVIIMFFLGMHTYKMNQDKRFELQVRLAQARQNSMYLSSMVLANQANVNDICNQFGTPLKSSMYAADDEEKGSRRPVILDAEKQLLLGSNQQPMGALVALKPTAVQLQGQSIQTMPIPANMSFTLDAPGNWQGVSESMTLHRRVNGGNQRPSGVGMNHSQSILTVASMNNGQFTVLPHQNAAFYPQVSVISEYPAGQNYLSLQRSLQAQRPSYEQKVPTTANSISSNKIYTGSTRPAFNANVARNSPSYSSSTSATNQSVITNANYVPPQRDFQ